MEEKDYYLILGIPRAAGSEAIREAFRELAKRYHPDRAGSQGTERFQKIAEAYTTLSDPEKRHRYNHWLDGRRDRMEPAAEPMERPFRPEPVEPLFREPVSLFRDFHGFGPSREEIHRRIRRNFDGVGASKAETVEPLEVELVLTPEEAARGGTLPLAIPVFRDCPLCEGTGDDWGFGCLLCGGGGMIEEEAVVRLGIRPGVIDRSVYEIPISGLGVHNFYLRVVLRVAS